MPKENLSSLQSRSSGVLKRFGCLRGSDAKKSKTASPLAMLPLMTGPSKSSVPVAVNQIKT